eukprot:353807_1
MNWFGKKKKDSKNKQRSAPPARKHPQQYSKTNKTVQNAPKPPQNAYPQRQAPKYNNNRQQHSQSVINTPQKQQSRHQHSQSVYQTPQQQPPPDDDDD